MKNDAELFRDLDVWKMGEVEQSNAATACLQLWHERFAHKNEIDLRNLPKAVVDMKLENEENEFAMCATQKKSKGYRLAVK